MPHAIKHLHGSSKSIPNIQTRDIISSLWIGDKLSQIERLTILSFLNNGHPFHLYTYDHVSNIPDGAIVLDANSIIPKKEIFTSHGGYAHFADWFRWRLLSLLGGYWVDMDVICLRPFDFTNKVVFGYEVVNRANVSVLRFPRDHPVCSEMEDRCKNPNKIRNSDKFRDTLRKLGRKYVHGNSRGSIKWGEAGGPDGFTKVLEQYGMLGDGLPFTYFYPISWQNAKCIFDATLSHDLSMFTDTYAIHLWNEIIRKSRIDKNADFDSNSMIFKLLNKYES